MPRAGQEGSAGTEGAVRWIVGVARKKRVVKGGGKALFCCKLFGEEVDWVTGIGDAQGGVGGGHGVASGAESIAMHGRHTIWGHYQFLLERKGWATGCPLRLKKLGAVGISKTSARLGAQPATWHRGGAAGGGRRQGEPGCMSPHPDSRGRPHHSAGGVRLVRSEQLAGESSGEQPEVRSLGAASGAQTGRHSAAPRTQRGAADHNRQQRGTGRPAPAPRRPERERYLVRP